MHYKGDTAVFKAVGAPYYRRIGRLYRASALYKGALSPAPLEARA
jgi:hypothetical protein